MPSRSQFSLIYIAYMAILLSCALVMGGCSSSTNTSEEQPAQQEETDEAQSDDMVANEPSTEEAPVAAPVEVQTDPRDAEFAVDPARTDWNYEPGEQKTVYLTFDDGPSAHTQEVLDILDAYGIKATFFVTAINPDYLDMIGECYRRGHTIGMHTYSHDYAQVYASYDAYWADLNAIAAIVQEQIGYVPCFIRFPGGSSNTVSRDYCAGIMSTLAEDVLAKGYQYFDWDASCGDGAEHTADELVDATIADTSYGYTSIVFLMHDGAEKATTVEALPRIIEYFQSEGYTFAPLDRSTPAPHHGIGN